MVRSKPHDSSLRVSAAATRVDESFFRYTLDGTRGTRCLSPIGSGYRAGTRYAGRFAALGSGIRMVPFFDASVVSRDAAWFGSIPISDHDPDNSLFLALAKMEDRAGIFRHSAWCCAFVT